MTQLLTEAELKEWTSYKHQGDLEKFLQEHRIPYFRGKGGKLLTTLGLIENSQSRLILSAEPEL